MTKKTSTPTKPPANAPTRAWKRTTTTTATRAVAVVVVVLFHARVGAFAGGFVGVDVFFVISGYLITGLILNHEGTLQEFLGSFYERRIRRLFPPLIPVLAFTSFAAGVWFLPGALEEYSKSL